MKCRRVPQPGDGRWPGSPREQKKEEAGRLPPFQATASLVSKTLPLGDYFMV